MLKVTQIRGNNQYAVSHYFATGDDYYSKESPGEWQGEGAQLLGLSGSIEQAQLSRLLNGQLPNGEQIQASFDKEENKKRMGLDLTFSAPKSVSMQALIAGDKGVTDAHDKAVAQALREVERLAEARKKVKGKTFRERTGNMVIGKFRHEMSRAKDPQLHTHAVVLNMTQRSDGAWRAISNEDIFRVQHELDALYKAELAKGLQELGYSIRLTDDQGNFELAHINREQIEAFSSRSMVIEEALANEGKTRATATTLEKQIIALATRQRKDESDRHIIKQYWVHKSSELGIEYGVQNQQDFSNSLRSNDPKNLAITSLPASMTPAQAVVQYAINHLTEREAVVSESALTAVALRRAVGLAGTDDVKAEIKRLVGQGTLIESVPAYRMADRKDGPSLSAAGWKSYLQELKGWNSENASKYVRNAIRQGSLVQSEKRYTTQKALKREKAILAIERDGRGKVEPILSLTAVNEALKNSNLNPGQRSAVETIVATNNRFVGIQGDAGTGKTYTVNEAVKLIKEASAISTGYRTVALAPYGNQVKALKNEGLEAHTLASFLNTKNKPIDGNTVIVLDEAGVVGARQMEQVMRIVEKAGARMVLLGDTKQTEAIEAGKPFAQLQQAGMSTARISEIQRQKNVELKTAVEHAAEGRVSLSLSQVKHVEEFENPEERHRAIVTDYIGLTEKERQGTLIISGTNASRREINGMVRESLDLVGKGREFETLTRVDMTQAQRRFAPSYKTGMVIQPEQDYKKAGLVRGETYTVKEALPGNKLLLENKEGVSITINPRQVTKVSVYHLERTELSIGDTVRINRNDPGLDLTNGDRMRVAGIVGGVVKLDSVEQQNDRPVRSVELVSNKPLHLEHAYASTVHSSQGLTSDKVFVSLDTKSRTTSLNLYYVAISRGKHEARIYTNSVKDLPVAVSRRFDKTTALELQKQRQIEKGSRMEPKGVADGKKGIGVEKGYSKF